MSMTSLPSRWVANRCSSSRSRGGGSSSISALAASIRNFGFDGPGRRRRGAARPAPCGPGSAGVPPRRPPAAAARPSRARTRRTRPRRRRPTPSCTSQVHWQTASRNHRSWVTTTSAEARCARWSASQADGLDVEVVGGLVEHDQVVVAEQQRGQRAAAALAAGEPDDRAVERDARPAAPRRPRGSAGRRPTRGRSGRPAPPRARCGCRRARRPGGGSRRAARAPARPGRCRAARARSSPRSSVVLPSPLRPTMPIRSPGRDARARRRSSSGRTPYALETRSRLSRLAHGPLIGPALPATGPVATSTHGVRRRRSRSAAPRWAWSRRPQGRRRSGRSR